MKVLLDENLPHALRAELPSHDVFTAQYLGWSGTKNGRLLARAEANDFDVLVTMDDGIGYQQNIAARRIGIIVLRASSSDIEDLRSLIPKLRRGIERIKPGTLIRIN